MTEKRQHKTNAHEQAYITTTHAFYGDSKKRDHDARAQAYSDAMKRVYEQYPDDHKAAAFYALSLLTSDPNEDENFTKHRQTTAILEKLFAVKPDHPGIAHYLIHSYDKPQLAKLGIPAAQRYAQVAPAAPHALHMPSHIFARIGLWQDDINSNLTSITATRKTAAMHINKEGHQFHTMDFLIYAYLQNRRETETQKIIEEVKAMPPMHDMYNINFDPRTFTLNLFPAIYDLELHRWSDAAALTVVESTSQRNQTITH